MFTHPQPATCLRKGVPSDVLDQLVVEEPLQITINGKPFSITMRTPGADEYLVKGLLLAEGVAQPEGLEGPVELQQLDGYTEARITIPEIFLCQDLLEKRSLIATASCGFCGKREIADIGIDHQPLQPESKLDPAIIPALQKQMRERQAGFDATGGCHAAAAFTIGGDLIVLFEDIGRHNAVDKVVGYLADKRLIGDAAILFVSGRVSFEIVSKAIAAKFPFICAVSAASSLAIDTADRLGMTLIAFCRDERMTVYSNPQHINLLYSDS
jgi:FdhD protein